MNRWTFAPWSIGTRLIVVLVIAVLIPLTAVAFFSFQGSAAVNRQTIQAYVREAGDRRAQVITATLDKTLAYIDAILANPDNNRAFFNAFFARNPAVATSRLEAELNNSQGLVESAWLMNRSGTVLADAAALDKIVPYNNPDLRQSAVFQAAEGLNPQGRTRDLVVDPDAPGGASVQVVSVLLDQNERLMGYLVVTLNLDTLFYSNMTDTASLGMYSFVILPDGITVIAPETTLPLVSLTSAGVRSAINRESAAVETYLTGSGSSYREVLGYHADINLLDKTFLILTEIDSSIVTDRISAYIRLSGFPLIVGTLVIGVVLAALLSYGITTPVNLLNEAMRALMRGNYDAPVPEMERVDEIGTLTRSFVNMRQQFRTTGDDMTRRLRDRDRDVRVTQDISRALTNERDLINLMNKVVNLILENFPSIYHAQIFLVDSEKFAVLRASTGEAGKALMARGHRLQVGSVSVIGQVIEQGQTILARDTAASDVHRRNEFLQETRSELAIPLQIGMQVIGALDVQSKQRDAFSEDLMNVMQTLAGQVTIAIENVRLYEESQRRLAAIADDQREITRRAWQDYWNARRQVDLEHRTGNTTTTDFTALRLKALRENQAVVGERTPQGTIPFVVPLRLRGEPLGVVEYELAEKDFRYDKVLLAEELANRLAITLDNARLFQESQKAAERERMVNTISARLTGQTDIQQIIQTAIREVGQALRTPQVAVRLRLNADGHDDSGTTETGNGTVMPADTTSTP